MVFYGVLWHFSQTSWLLKRFDSSSKQRAMFTVGVLFRPPYQHLLASACNNCVIYQIGKLQQYFEQPWPCDASLFAPFIVLLCLVLLSLLLDGALLVILFYKSFVISFSHAPCNAVKGPCAVTQLTPFLYRQVRKQQACFLLCFWLFINITATQLTVSCTCLK